MRRWNRPGIAVLAVLLVVGGYIAYWQVIAGRIENGVRAWQQSAKKQKIDASWQGLRVTGFPFAFRIEVDNAAFRDRSWIPAPELRIAHLTGTARPWNFRDWRLSAPHGFAADLAPAGGRAALRLAARSAHGIVVAGAGGGTWLWLRADDIAAEAAAAVPIRSADAWLILPAQPAAKDTDPNFGLALDLHRIGVAAPPVNFRKTIDELALGVTIKGAFPPGPLPQAAALWRDAGGTVEIDNLRVDWSGLGITANGTLALDHKLQPIAALSGGIEGFGAILNALVAADQMTPEQAALVQIALTQLAKPGPDGKPQITAPFTIQNGKMYLGPARLGSIPRLVWQ